MKHLSGLDASFLFVETPQMPMHVGALHIIELPKGHRGGFVNTLRRHIAQRLHLAAPLRRRLAELPLGFANPVWIDAEPDLEQHIVEIKLPKGSGQAELERQVGELHVQLLDRSRPLWKFHVFDGLAPGPDGAKRVALYTQLHHAAVDGQAAVAIAERIPPLANVAISNVPGPPVPLYWAGAKMLTNYPTSIVVHGIALNITVQSYNQSMDFGLMACGKALPEVRELADAIVIAFDDLKGLPLPQDATDDAPRRGRGLVAKARHAVAGAVSKVTAGARATAPGKPARAR